MSDPFAEFLKLCDDQGLRDRPSGLAADDAPDGLVDETTLRRFFNARGKNPVAAAQQLKDATTARQAVNAIPTYEAIDVDLYERARRIYPHWIGRRDKRGLPIFAFDISVLDQATLTEYKKTSDMPHAGVNGQSAEPNQMQRAFAFHDTIVRFILPLCSAMRDRPNSDVPISSAVYLVDISTMGVKQALSVRNYAQNVSSILATSFPEVLDTVYICNAPSYFSTIWSIVKHFLDPRTAEKLVILTKDQVLPTLSTSIDPADIPVPLGGQLKYEIGMLPSLDDKIAQELKWTGSPGSTLPRGPLKWVEDGEGRRTAVAVGTSSNQPRRDVFAVLDVGRNPLPEKSEVGV